MRHGERRPFRQRYRERPGRIGLVLAPIRRGLLERVGAPGDAHLFRNGAGTQLGQAGGRQQPEEELMTEANADAPFGQAEHWATHEDLPAMLQLGVVQPPGPPPS